MMVGRIQVHAPAHLCAYAQDSTSPVMQGTQTHTHAHGLVMPDCKSEKPCGMPYEEEGLELDQACELSNELLSRLHKMWVIPFLASLCGGLCCLW